MTMSATVGGTECHFFAKLSDGRSLAQPDLRAMARALVHAGVQARGINNEWMAGYRMLTAGQKVALSSEMLGLERKSANITLAA